jgi:hypothetical protein
MATGDGVFSVGISRARSITLSSSSNIIGHKPFEEEYLAFLKKHGAHFDEKYLWDQRRPIIPYRTGRLFRRTLSQALRARLRSACPSGTKSHSSIEGPRIKLALMGFTLDFFLPSTLTYSTDRPPHPKNESFAPSSRVSNLGVKPNQARLSTGIDRSGGIVALTIVPPRSA